MIAFPYMLSEDQAQALDVVLNLDVHLWYDTATALSCMEIEAIVGLLRTFGMPEATCDGIIAAHAEGDDEGDSHYQGVTE